MPRPATDPQIDQILRLVNRRDGSRHNYLSQARRALGLSSSKINRGLSTVEASAIIDALTVEEEDRERAAK